MSSTLQQLKNNMERVKNIKDEIIHSGDDINMISETLDIPLELAREIESIPCETLDILNNCLIAKINKKISIDGIHKHYSALPNFHYHILLSSLLYNGVKNNNENININNIDNININNINNSNKNAKVFAWWPHQITAINNTIKQGFVSGIHNHIMGAGKSNIILNTIWAHFTMTKQNNIYILLCDRQDILITLFLEPIEQNGEIIYKLSQSKIKEWANNNIINLNAFNVINYVTNKPSDINTEITDDKPNLIIINNAFKRVRQLSDSVLTRTKLILLDECHSISGPKLYDMLYKYKYDPRFSISIIGFSATPLREKAESNLCNIFSKTIDKNKINKKVNVISSYNLFSAITDRVVLPFKYICYEINDVEKNESNKKNKRKNDVDDTVNNVEEIEDNVEENK